MFLTVLLTLIYPLTIWFGEGRFEPRLLAGILLMVGLARLLSFGLDQRASWICAGATMVFVLLATWENEMLPLKLYPVLVNATLLGAFSYSLIVPPAVVERMARRRQPNLPPQAIAYTRRVTQIWCGFFGINGAVALYTALYASSDQWSFYNGFVAYVLIGLLFGGEYCVRRCVMGQLRG